MTDLKRPMTDQQNTESDDSDDSQEREKIIYTAKRRKHESRKNKLRCFENELNLCLKGNPDEFPKIDFFKRELLHCILGEFRKVCGNHPPDAIWKGDREVSKMDEWK